ncbi:GDSL-type esterase/lipase family protein [Streptomyces capparidis]
MPSASAQGRRISAGLLVGALAALVASALTGPPASAEPAGQARPAQEAQAAQEAQGAQAVRADGREAVWSASLRGRNGVSPDTTVRNIARVSVPATSLRIRIGNPYGDRPATFRSATVGLQTRVGEADVQPGSLRVLTFGGRRAVTLRPGQRVYSDPVPLRVAAGRNLAISLYAPGAPVNDVSFPPPSVNPPASFLSVPGDHTRDVGDGDFPETDKGLSAEPGYHPGQLWWTDVVDAKSPAAGTVVALGDSNTAGHNATGGERWTDLLAARLNALPGKQRLAVANAGISGNTVSRQANPYDPTGQCCGAPAPDRLDEDALNLAGAKHLILLEGTNDLGGGASAAPASAAQVIAAMQEIADRAHARGLKVIGGTLMPMCNAAGSEKEANRLAVNAFVRTSGVFDGVIDFDAAVRDAADPTVIADAYRADCYHPNAKGHEAMAAAIDTGLFS